MIKKIICGFFIIMIVVLVAPVMFATADNSPTGAYLKITLMSQEPDPVEPGNMVDVRFKIENLGSQGTDEVTFALMPKYPFKLPPGEPALQYPGSFRAGQKAEEGVIAKYRLIVDEHAVEGNNELELRYKVGSGEWVRLEPFNISIRPFDAILTIEDVKVDPEMIAPGSLAKIAITVRNLAESTLKKVRAKIDLTNIPLAPSTSSNEKALNQILPGEDAVFSFDVIAEAEAESKLYKVPFKLNYNDDLGRNYSRDTVIGIVIGDEPDMYVTIDSSEVYKTGQVGTVTIKLVNKGISDIKLVNAKVKETAAFELISPSELYIGNIDSDDYESAEIKLLVKEGKDSIKIPLEIEYRGANNQPYKKMVDLSLKLYSESEAKKIGLAKGNSFGGVLVMIIIITAGLFGYWKWRKSKKKHA